MRLFVVASALLLGCGSGEAASSNDASPSTDVRSDAIDSGTDDTGAGDDTGTIADAIDSGDAFDATPPFTDSLGSNRDRLLGTYFDWLKAHPTETQSNGLSGGSLTSVCDLWSKLQPSAQAVYLTITHRMQGSHLGSDGSSMLWHVTKLYRLSGGQDATVTSAGSCGGAEYNRMMMSMDTKLHDAMVAANTNKGAKDAGKFDIDDIPAGESWRDSHDLGGPHAPFDLSDETNSGAPRGQTQYFKDPSSTLAKTALGRLDLKTLVDPLGLEMDQDYDCVHNSNPSCSYITYGALCLPQTSLPGTKIYENNYGAFDPTWVPTGCKGK